MSVQNLSFLAGLEVTEKFVWCVVGWGGGGGYQQVATLSNLNEGAYELLWVELSYIGFWQ